MIDYDKKLSNTISFMRFPLAVMVVLIHATLIYEQKNGTPYINEIDTPIYCGVDFLFRQSICSLAVPLFFFISGMLFFWNIEKLNLKIFERKIKTRITSLFIPYIFWNLLILVYVLLVQQIFPGIMSAKNKLVSDYSVLDFLNCFWNMSLVNNGGGNFPIDGPLWFIRDLIIMNLLSPAVYFVLSRLKGWGAMALFAIWFFDLLSKFGNFSTAILFYSFGAYWGITKSNILEKTEKFHQLIMGGYIILLILALIYKNVDTVPYLFKIEKAFGFLSILWMSFFCSGKYHFSKLLTGATFVMFAVHSDILKVFIKIFFKMSPWHFDTFYVLAYFILATVAIVLSVSFYWMLNRCMPRFCRFISGGR